MNNSLKQKILILLCRMESIVKLAYSLLVLFSSLCSVPLLFQKRPSDTVQVLRRPVLRTLLQLLSMVGSADICIAASGRLIIPLR